MHRTMLNLVVLAALCWPGQAFLQDLLPHLNLNLQPQYPQYPQYQYRRAAYEPQPQPVHYGYTYSRPAFYQQWLPGSRPAYEAGTAYSYAGGNANNPFSSFLQGSWLPWSTNRQPVQQQQQLSAQYVSSQPQQPQQPIWGLLPWGSSSSSGSGAQQGGNTYPVLSWLQQHPLQLPWGQQQQQQQVVYTTPLAPTPAAPAPAAVSTLHVVTAEAPVAAGGGGAHLPSSSAVIKPEGVVLEGEQYQQLPAISSNAIRRVTLEHEHADGQPCV
ncbi:Anaerobic glycerol-3-phosphate dehydrogenase subunit B [Frankliniella fusca]|uniref:Anaerobic glycerol-3-phosphate dehydrogenase subunit B n=1 Tax=Frankliniella fusca TaxID=407009 RepID=A0AAE1HUY0_9NEOP|nr:Anaerobic glycerol-3-phosphate dehydrogenase subunit B [Frankliniella fusca]